MSTTCIYYALDHIQDEDRRSARAAAGPGAIEAASTMALWDGGDPAEEPHRVADHRGIPNQDRLMAWIVGVEAALKRSGLELERRGIDLLDVARYQLLGEVNAFEHGWWVIAELCRTFAPTRILWVCRPEWRTELSQRRAFAAAASAPGVTIDVLAIPAVIPFVRDLVRTLKVRAYRDAHRALESARARSRPRDRGDASGADVLVAEYYHHNLRLFAPIARELERRGRRIAWLAGRAPVLAAMDHHGLTGPVALLDRLAPARALVTARLGVRERAALARALAALPDEVMTSPPAGAASRPARTAMLSRALLSTLDEVAYWVEAYDAALPRLAPRLVLTCVHMGANLRACVAVARRHGIRTAFVQHGLVLDYDMYRFYGHERKLMWGDFERRHLERVGHPADSIRVVGSPLYDALLGKVAARGPRPFPAADEPLKIVFLPTRSEGFTLATGRAVLEGVVGAIAQLPRAELTLKPHPADRTQLPEEVMARHPRFTLLRQGNPSDLVLDSDVVVVYASTTGNEACLADRPLILVGTSATDYSRYTEYGAAIRVPRPEDVGDAIRRLADDPALREELRQGRRRLIDDMLNGGRGDAAVRVADELDHLGGLDTLSARSRAC